jgi:hypothetical protein
VKMLGFFTKKRPTRSVTSVSDFISWTTDYGHPRESYFF